MGPGCIQAGIGGPFTELPWLGVPIGECAQPFAGAGVSVLGSGCKLGLGAAVTVLDWGLTTAGRPSKKGSVKIRVLAIELDTLVESWTGVLLTSGCCDFIDVDEGLV